jgi:carbon-monoxide dehydrogenase small subunit
MRLSLVLNGVPRRVDADPTRRLLDFLREEARLSGTKEGCGEGECGACAVLLDGVLVTSCLVPMGQLDGAAVVTIEGLGASADRLAPVQAALVEEGGAQCGICTPGIVLAAHALLAENPRPTLDEAREALAGNLCRCTGYAAILRAVLAAAGGRAAGGDQ